MPGIDDIESDATPDAKTVGACGVVRAPQPMVGNRVKCVEMRNSSPPSPWLTTGAGRRRLGDRTVQRDAPPHPTKQRYTEAVGDWARLFYPFLVLCAKYTKNVNVNVKYAFHGRQLSTY